MSQATDLTRRTFLKAGIAAGGGLIIGFTLPGISRLAQAGSVSSFVPNAWLRISPDESITIVVAKSEMGQGVYTSMPMLVAEELEVDLEKVRLENAPPGKEYVDALTKMQVTGGSTSVRSGWKPLREAGAAARTMLIAAAAQVWNVNPGECRAESGAVLHPASKRRLSYGQLAQGAAKQSLPKKIELKKPDQYRYLGKPVHRLDTPAKTDGSAVFGIDVNLPGLLTATLVRCPVFGGRLASFDAEPAKAVKGVKQVFQTEDGIAVLADGFWAANKGREALKTEWDEGPLAKLDSAAIEKQFMEGANKSAVVARRENEVDPAFKKAASKVEAEYHAPFAAHVTMEPMNCTVDLKPDRCEIWVGTQSVAFVQAAAAKITGLPPEAIKVNLTYLGGGFGRRSEVDFVIQALRIAQQAKAPVKLIWTREDDMQHDVYRPASFHRLSAALDSKGQPLAWKQRIVSPSILKRLMPQNLAHSGKLDSSSVEGSANLPYAVPNILVDYVMADPGVPVGFWRSVGNSQNGFVTECFIDELAAAARQDPLQFRLKLLEKHPRHRAVLQLAAEKAGWSGKLPAGQGRGVAVLESFGSYVAEVAEVEVGKDKNVKVRRVVCAIDCGSVVNPDTIRAQLESAVVYALTAVLKGPITIRDGRVEQSNFHDYPLLKLEEMPIVEAHILPSSEPPGGVGEPGVPPLAPAVANAVFAATGQRVRRLPISL
ncbi:MAG: xanthine dehydrogenase family protein molybdopterin-binding subunit [Proteobacteria bacterium]|nr:xanthine dehydrogenase family protein molybdopterin-binding subunit [Pseudomonadota bacterium]